MRGNVQIIGADSGNHLWGELFNKPPERSATPHFIEGQNAT